MPPKPLTEDHTRGHNLPPFSTVADIDPLQKIWAEKGNAIIVGAILFSIAAAVACTVLGIGEWQTGKAVLKKDLSNLNDVGSYLQGTAASLWALAGFFILFVAFLVQAVTFTEQRKQFKLQTDSINRQNFEASFFQLLGLHNEIVVSTEDSTHSGRACFTEWYRSFKYGQWGSKYAEINLYGERELIASPKDGIDKYLAFYYEAHQGKLGHYFRNLYHLFKFVNEAEALKHTDPEIEYKTRRRYTSLVRATS